MEDENKKNHMLKELISSFKQRIILLIPSSLSESIYKIFTNHTFIESETLYESIVTILEKYKQYNTNEETKENIERSKGKWEEYLMALVRFYKDLAQVFENEISVRLKEAFNSIAKDYKEKYLSKNLINGNGNKNSIHLDLNFLTHDIRKMLEDLIYNESRLKLGLVFMLGLIFALYLKPNPFVKNNIPKNVTEIAQLLDPEEANLVVEFPKALLSSCFTDILVPLIQSFVYEIKCAFQFDVIIEYFVLIGFLLDIEASNTNYYIHVKRGLTNIPVALVIRTLIACYMKSDYSQQKLYYSKHFLSIISDNNTAISMLINVIFTTEWPLEKVKKTVGDLLVSIPEMNNKYYKKIVTQL